MKSVIIPTIITLSILLNACHSPPKSQVILPPTSEMMSGNKIAFNIMGKIGITTQTKDGKQAGSAFYNWVQNDENFIIDLTGALGVGATQIHYDGQLATLTNNKSNITADTPEELLLKTTGWHAPISQLPHWIMGRSAEGDESIFEDKLRQAVHGDWTAEFDYPKNSSRPNRLVINHVDGHRVVMTVTHQ